MTRQYGHPEDEAFYPKLMELKGSVPEYKNLLIACLGGLHTAFNFHRVLGWYMHYAGLLFLQVVGRI